MSEFDPSNNIPFSSIPLVYCDVIIPINLPNTYTWEVPEHIQNTIQIGIRVEVSLRNKKYAGIVKRIHHKKPELFQPKPIINILDETPILYPMQLQFWEWMAQYYLCSEGEVMQAALPAHLKLSGESIVIWNEGFEMDSTQLTDDEFLVAEALEIRKELRLQEIQQILSSNHVYPVIKKLIDKKACFIWETLQEKYRHKTETYITLQPQYQAEADLEKLLNEWNKAPKQLELLLAYIHLSKTEGEVTQSNLLKKSGATVAQLKALIEKGIVQAQKRPVDRIRQLPQNIHIDFTLSIAQQQALNSIQKNWEEKQVCLLHGVTSSGKTQIYIQLIKEAIDAGRQILYLLPEIALTAQIIRRLQKNLGGYIAVYHSKFNANERVEIWNKVKNGEIAVVLGARSALMLPFKNLGLIIIDEEQDSSFKQQDPAPRYQARDAAIFFASLNNAKVLLGSATPSVETYFNCKMGKYGLVELLERFGDVALPKIEIVDIKKAMAAQKGKVAFSAALVNQLQQTLIEKKQAIIFQNRRGYSPYLMCQTCGWIPQCKHCAVTLTYHKAKNTLVCHYCGSNYPVMQTCVVCGSHAFTQKNFGTEKIEELLAEALPTAKIARMDLDSVKGKNDHDTLIKQFEQHKIDILVGTQMVVKGLDFENVQLVGIIDADSILNFTDFRVNERAFQLMEQVSGRSGRKDGNGIVLVQVSNTHHPVLAFVQQHQYEALYQFEMESRKAYHYPPYSRLIKLIFKHKDNPIAQQASFTMMQLLDPTFHPYINGPAVPVIERIRNQYIWEILLKLPKNQTIILKCKQAIMQYSASIKAQKQFRSVQIIVDVDPY
ncbi:MAG: primosomal protein N' [Sphingobacteriales bacterium]|uniref:replication restart helicase PriA n=1 Tax=Hydrotalea flava TaxID=714549 RepID=UPI00082BBE1F|nr:primosomal protein N' [Hydrotalea flava]RTL56637.1 MAG: primosomal protein N' [Sphingobacteriales bacterium]